MPVKPHIKMVFRGVFTNSPEIWSFSTKWSKDVQFSRDADVSDITTANVTSALAAFLGSPLFQNNVKATDWRAYDIGSNGKMTGNPLLVDVTGNNIQGTGTARSYPTDVALCVTTVGPDRGHGRFGRFYLPGPHSGLDNGRRVPLSDLQAMHDATVTFLKAVSDQIDIPDNPIDGSYMLNISNDAEASWQEVQNLKLGRVLDRISRRRNALDEEYLIGSHIDW
jgi:hypothetical protein